MKNLDIIELEKLEKIFEESIESKIVNGALFIVVCLSLVLSIVNVFL